MATTKAEVPSDMAGFTVGIIGMGDMGKIVEAAAIDRVVAQYGPSTKLGAIVGGQTSCKDPEIKAFEAHLPEDVDIVSCHSLHGPRVDPRDQPLVIIKHRSSAASAQKVETILSCLNSKIVYLTAHEHDRITADTQAVTHAAFLSMGKAWHASQEFPWEGARYVGGIENVKINLMLRIYSQKWHVYAGLAILNPEARKQIAQYAESTTELYKLMLGATSRSCGRASTTRVTACSGAPASLGKMPESLLPNNHLSLLAMVDCWSALGIVPYDHMICSTPLFRLWLGVTETLFRNEQRLDEAIRVAIDDNTFRSDDLEFTFCCPRLGRATAAFFEPRIAEAMEVGNAMVKAVLESTKK
ncbi:hypothetical protein PG993_001125 [Apiospora rasikravindrae]|uniref:Prephenate/arogenate dehydrogenase domain-containing protein n=1 Tax=Apiospora rasikravindrae TaxID=990691 RepID=A0ABR1UAF7_9PEZI